jgi:hypothetical protein
VSETPASTETRPDAAGTAEVPPAGLAAEAAPKPDAAPQTETPTGTETGGDSPHVESPPVKPKRGKPKSSARKTRAVELILTISGGPDGEWQADLRHGTDRVVQGLALPAAAVSRAAKELHPEISGGIETVLDETRKQHRERLEQLEAELSKVKQALAELDDEDEA